jgi:dTDP-4-dehydrorhamnose reductase
VNILLLGKDGQVGWELQRALAPLGRITACDQNACDLGDAQATRELVRSIHPDVIVNAAAYTAVDRAESERDLAWAVNATAPGLLAEEAVRLGAWLVHYSTDYVFDGRKDGAYLEADATGPLSVYGASKLAGEQAIVASGCHHLIFRTSWVYAARGGNFAKTMLRLARERDTLRVVGDQVGAPTAAELIADVTAHCLRDVTRPGGDALLGLYHLAAAGETSWHGYAQFVLQQAQAAGVKLACPPPQVQAIATADYPTPAKRPANSRLATAKLQRSFGLTLPDWTYHARRTLAEIFTQEKP